MEKWLRHTDSWSTAVQEQMHRGKGNLINKR